MKYEDLKVIKLEPQEQKTIANNTFQFEPTYQATNKPIQFRNTYLQDVQDHIQLSWLGQIADYYDMDQTYLSEPKETIDVLEELPLRYKPFAKSFRGVRNRKHMEAIMNRIDRNLDAKGRLDYSDRLTPGFVAALADPITYVPIPFAKGIGFFKGAAKAGTIGAGLIGATEVPRIALDPTATYGESVANMSFAFAVSGLFGGIYGRLTETVGEQATRRIFPTGRADDVVDNYNQTMDEVEGGINPDNTEIIFNFKSDAPGVVITNKNERTPNANETRASVRHIGTMPRETVDRALSDKGIEQAVGAAEFNPNVGNRNRIAKFNAQKNQVDVDFVKAKGQWMTGKHLVYLNNLGIRVGPNYFKTPEDWIRFNIKKSIYEELPAYEKLDTESFRQYERRINSAVIRDTKLESAVIAKSDTNSLLKLLPNWTNASMVQNTLDKKVSSEKLKKMIVMKHIELSGDYATVNTINDLEKALPESVVTAVGTRHNSQIALALRSIEKKFLELYGADPNIGVFREGLVRTAIATKSLVNKAQNLFNRQARGADGQIDFKEYSILLGRYIIDPESLTNTLPENVIANIAESAQIWKKVTKYYDDQLAQQGMYANQQSYLQLIRKKEYALNRIEGLLTDETRELVGTQNYRRLEQMKAELIEDTNRIRRIQEVFPADRPYWGDEDYFHRMWKREAILENVEQFKGILRRYVQGQLHNNLSRRNYIIQRNRMARTDEERINPNGTTEEILDAEVEFYYNDIVDNQARWQDGEGIAGYGVSNNRYKIGATPLLDRKLKIPNKDVIDFIETDASFILRSYQQRVAPAVELANKFGDVHLQEYLINTEIDLILDGTTTRNRNAILNSFIDEKDKILGTLYSSDPTSINVRVAQAMRNWASLAYMGRVIFSALPELARPIMTNGVGSVMKGNIEPFAMGMNSWRKSNLSDIRFLSPVIEMTLNSFNRRFMYDGGISHSRRNTMGWFDKYLGQYLERPQNMFYILNGLTPWTHMIKEMHGLVAMHRLIEDSLKWADGSLDKFGRRRLASFGIDEKTALTIAKMPIQKNGDQILANAQEWTRFKGGTIAQRKLATAIYADVQRTIVTPSVADRPNMMQGVIRINNEGISELMNNPLMRGLGFEKTDYGGKFNNAYMALLFQFYSYGVSSVKRIGTNVLQNRDGASAAVSGAIGMVTLGFVADWFKSGDYYSSKDFGEKIVRAVELSGITTLAGDMNYMVETISGGFFDTPMGVRPMLGLDGRFGTPDETDAWGEITGASPGMLFDLHKAFTSDDLSERQRHAIFRRSIPGNSLWFWDDEFRSVYNYLAGIE